QEQQAQAERHHWEMMQVLQQQKRAEQPPIQPQPQPNQGAQSQVPRGNPVFCEFCRMNPPTFEGQYEPTEASEWLFRMEDMLEDLECTPAEK
ncbi:hypothetical protein A2U01_0079676, partial [Trifolium medium]|nr:hypothetical protein [Trifolium medium]